MANATLSSHGQPLGARDPSSLESSDISRYKLQATRVDTDRLVTYVTPRGGEDKYDRALSRRQRATPRRQDENARTRLTPLSPKRPHVHIEHKVRTR